MAKKKASKIEPPRDVAGYDPVATAGDCVWDADAAQLILDFFPRYLVHIKGRIANQPMEPNPWERDFLATLFGWKRRDGTRRYRESFVGIPRKNNKTTLSAGIALFMLMCDNEAGAEVYCAAADKDQATLLFSVAAANVRKHPTLSKQCHIRDAEKRIIFRKDSLMRAIPADAAGSHGFNAHCVIMDELHTQPNRDLYDVLKTSMAARRQPLIVSITTAGHDKESVCYELWDYSRKVRDGVIDDQNFLPCLYEATDKDDWKSPKTWKRCNPNFGRSVSEQYLKEAFERAKKTPSFENTFKNLHLNIWTESQTRWITSESWDVCEGEIPNLDGKDCWVGMDLGSTSDLTALVYVFPVDEQIYIVPHFFCPEEVVRQAPKQYQRQYADWLSKGLITPTPGSATDYAFVRQRILEDRERYNIKEIAFDAWQALDTFNQLEQEGFECVKVSQSFGGMWPGVKAVEEAILDKTLVHDGNAVLRWMVASTVVDQDANGNRKPNKKKSQGEQGTKGKIDGVVAMCMAMSRAVNYTPDEVVYNERGILSL